MTLEKAFETARILAAEENGGIAYSRSGELYAFGLVRGDVQRDGVVVEIFAGSLRDTTRLKPRLIKSLFTRGWGPDVNGRGNLAGLTFGFPPNALRWLDESSVAFFWQDESENRQIFKLDVIDGALTKLTRSEGDATFFGVGPAGEIVFRAKRPTILDRANTNQQGMVLEPSDALGLLYGSANQSRLSIDWGNEDWYVAKPGQPAKKVSLTGAGATRIGAITPPSFSHDGRWAIVEANPSSIPFAWSAYDSPTIQSQVEENSRNPDALNARLLMQQYVIDLRDGSGRPLIEAPFNNVSSALPPAWSPDNHHVLVDRTFLPLEIQSPAGMAGRAVAVVDVATGSTIELELTNDERQKLSAKRWVSEDRIELSIQNRRIVFGRDAVGGWIRTSEASAPNSSAEGDDGALAFVQDLNHPPGLYLKLNGGRSRLLFQTNQALVSSQCLGRVEAITWSDAEGRAWRGKLFYPVGFDPARRYPLVIQTNAADLSLETFDIYGKDDPGLGPGNQPFIAQTLAGRGIMVLEGGRPVTPRSMDGVKRLSQAQSYVRGYEGAARELIARGIVQADRVGLIGFSNRGWQVEYALSYSDFPWAAAIVSDNITGGYLDAALSNWSYAHGEDLVGDKPFGTGWKAWLENSPTFAAERVRTPLLRMVTGSISNVANVIGGPWETYSRLRYLNIPVELYLAPRFDRGAHNLQNPSQVLDVQRRALDWWLFWLKDAPPEVGSTAASWRHMRGELETLRSQPRPPRLEWSARPR
ncbi:dipeptidyl aminopeptidase/acylaminoacyl peptidase [Sphingomonas kyeonggiensis]|uniref:Dipeptidyl aminopeptidase/acylaminoacyl peptidase n=1 Tax=Sphingomonas kyeonggiensis TaxID=1268553 RepID=A0A7W7JXQ7_9SPHN|nr:hypothetical protein [Sphingomonas kyeonggiensis]MBB4837043.1 dipeptidyl aminopeptidase/acylaminoacyl peptidase [Sphingomonas kyeonggiensis]